jgi:HK97 gp10 family phage protein
MKNFTSFAGMATELAGILIAQEEINHQLLERAAKSIEKRAKEKIGEYQPEAGQFVAWAELAESTKHDRESQGYPEDEPLLRSGELRDSIVHKVIGMVAHVGSDSDIAVYQELGTEKMPPRSFLGGAAHEKAPEIVEMIGENIALCLAGEKVFQGKLPIERE